MRNVYLKVNGEMAGICDRLNLKETKYEYGPIVEMSGSIGRIKVSKRSLVEMLIGAIHQNTAVELEFETEDSIWKAHRAWIIGYNCFEVAAENAIIVEDLRFQCETLVLIQKNEPVVLPLPKVEQDISAMINNFTAAITNYYKRNNDFKRQ